MLLVEMRKNKGFFFWDFIPMWQSFSNHMNLARAAKDRSHGNSSFFYASCLNKHTYWAQCRAEEDIKTNQMLSPPWRSSQSSLSWVVPRSSQIYWNKHRVIEDPEEPRITAEKIFTVLPGQSNFLIDSFNTYLLN